MANGINNFFGIKEPKREDELGYELLDEEKNRTDSDEKLEEELISEISGYNQPIEPNSTTTEPVTIPEVDSPVRSDSEEENNLKNLMNRVANYKKPEESVVEIPNVGKVSSDSEEENNLKNLMNRVATFGQKEPLLSQEIVGPQQVKPNLQQPVETTQNEVPSNTNIPVDQKIEQKLSEKDRLSQLIEQARNNRALERGISDVTGGLKRAAMAYAGGGLASIKPDMTMQETLSKRADEGFKEKLEEGKAEIASDRDKKIADVYRNILKVRLGDKYKDVDLDTLSTAEVIKAGQMVSQLGKEKSPEELAQLIAKTGQLQARTKKDSVTADFIPKRFEYKKKEKLEDDFRNALKDMRSTQSWKDAEKSLSEIPTIKALLTDSYEKGGQSLSMLGPKVSRGIANEVGTMTDRDVTRYVENPTIAGGLIDTMKKVTTGKISEASYDNIMRLLDIAKQTAKDKMQKSIDREAGNLAKREKMTLQDAKYYLDDKINVKGSESKIDEGGVDYVLLQAPDGKTAKVRKDAAQKYIDKGAKIIKD